MPVNGEYSLPHLYKDYMPYYWSQIETLENLQYVAGLVDGFNQDRFWAALMGKRSVGKDKIVHMRNELVEITNKLEEEYLVLDEFGKTFNDKFATRNNACFSSAMTLLRKMRSGMSKMIQIFRQFAPQNKADTRSGLSENIRRIFAQAAVFELLNWLENSIEEPEEEPKKGRLEILFRDFARLLQENKGRQREVRWYADRLAVTPKYLSVVCNTVTGKSAQVVINDLTVQEIKRLLLQTDMSVKEICGQMNFPSLSFFCKYTRQHLGMTAHQYRSSGRPHSTK